MADFSKPADGLVRASCCNVGEWDGETTKYKIY